VVAIETDDASTQRRYEALETYCGFNSAGPGAVNRKTVAALDPQTGLPLSWNPGQSQASVVGALLATADGLYVGSDSTLVFGAGHDRMAFFPVAGGTTVSPV
jgi:hypothetical protein